MFAVITKVPEIIDGHTSGNLATGLGSIFELDMTGVGGDQLGMIALSLGIPVFVLGEIMVLNGDGREVSGRGRKPSKWDVQYEIFTDVQDAIDCAQGVKV